MKDNATSAFRINYYSTCGGTQMNKTNKCQQLENGQAVEFEIEITATKCPENRADWTQVIQIYPVGLDESMIIEVTMLCDCECERTSAGKSVECKDNGVLRCGICECDELHTGKSCECLM